MPRPVITERKCCCANALPNAPGEVPVMNAGLPVQEFLPQGRAPQSIAFLRTAGMEAEGCREATRKPSAGANSSFEGRTFAARLASVVLVVHVRSACRATVG